LSMFLIDSLGSLVLTIVYPPEQMPKTNSIVNLAKKIMQMCPVVYSQKSRDFLGKLRVR